MLRRSRACRQYGKVCSGLSARETIVAGYATLPSDRHQLSGIMSLAKDDGKTPVAGPDRVFEQEAELSERWGERSTCGAWQAERTLCQQRKKRRSAADDPRSSRETCGRSGADSHTAPANGNAQPTQRCSAATPPWRLAPARVSMARAGRAGHDHAELKHHRPRVCREPGYA